MNYAEHLKTLKMTSPGYWWFGRPEGVDMRLELEILNGLAYIHSLNEIHRDLKPQNSISPLRDNSKD
jgi:serine/threonine protein kinase